MTTDLRTPTRSDAPSDLRRRRRSRLDLLAYSTPVALILGLLATYLLAPDFYLSYVLEFSRREYQIVEIATVASALPACLLLFWSAWRFGQDSGQRSGGVIVGVIGLATLFFAGEEISWGQTYLGWDTPEPIRPLGGETNLHNMRVPIPVQGLGSAFLLVMFVALPLAWRWRDRLPVPKGWACAIAEGPVVFSMVLAFAWKEIKTVYLWLGPEVEDSPAIFYVEFIEQINEQKELLVAVSLLIYALYRLRLARAIITRFQA